MAEQRWAVTESSCSDTKKEAIPIAESLWKMSGDAIWSFIDDEILFPVRAILVEWRRIYAGYRPL
jgi:hypothetical protein